MGKFRLRRIDIVWWIAPHQRKLVEYNAVGVGKRLNVNALCEHRLTLPDFDPKTKGRPTGKWSQDVTSDSKDTGDESIRIMGQISRIIYNYQQIILWLSANGRSVFRSLGSNS
jgi:hypothetical protein